MATDEERIHTLEADMQDLKSALQTLSGSLQRFVKEMHNLVQISSPKSTLLIQPVTSPLTTHNQSYHGKPTTCPQSTQQLLPATSTRKPPPKSHTTSPSRKSPHLRIPITRINQNIPHIPSTLLDFLLPRKQ
jgi:hypothetical protein